MNDKLIDRAFAFARRKHKDQKYGDNEPFIVHPQLVYEILSIVAYDDTPLLVAAVLHDTLEDTETNYKEIVDNFGIDVADLVKEVTETGYNTFPNLKTRRGYILKFADRLANLSNIHIWDEGRQGKYLLKSKFWKDE